MKNIIILRLVYAVLFITMSSAVFSQTNCDKCAPDTAVLDPGCSGGTGTITHLWSNNATTSTITVSTSGTYSVTCTDANGCTAEEVFNVTINPLPSPVASATDETCTGGDGTATVSPAFASYSWSNSATTQTITGLSAGNYTVTVTDANGCTNTATASVGTTANTVTVANVCNNVTCNGDGDGSATANPSGGTAPYTYAWSNSATAQTISNLSPGTYTVTVTDDNGCSNTGQCVITEPNALTSSPSCT